MADFVVHCHVPVLCSRCSDGSTSHVLCHVRIPLCELLAAAANGHAMAAGLAHKGEPNAVIYPLISIATGLFATCRRGTCHNIMPLDVSTSFVTTVGQTIRVR
jgi:hypothetical protein